MNREIPEPVLRYCRTAEVIYTINTSIALVPAAVERQNVYVPGMQVHVTSRAAERSPCNRALHLDPRGIFSRRETRERSTKAHTETAALFEWEQRAVP